MYQEYLFHLVNGEVISIWDNLAQPVRNTLAYDLINSLPNQILAVGNSQDGIYYIPRYNVMYVSTGERRDNTNQDHIDLAL